ncbi:MAG: lysine exporter protein LysE/YggA [Candidatus Taylorbacteria bacterium]|nr:lysine exporter protein LysE/YggA [Candidatus Taylorbacteria bacterium]
MYLAQFLTIAVIHLLAVASPGPDFVVVTKNSLSYSRRVGVYTALGVALGIAIHITYCLLGIALIISQSIIIFSIIKYIGAAYLIWIGYKGLRTKAKSEVDIDVEKNEKKDLPISSAIKSGFLVNVLNPKATLFLLAVFTQVINPETPKFIQTLYGLEMIVATFVWFALVSAIFSNKLMKRKITRLSHWIDRVGGAVMLALGIKVAISTQK